MVVALLVFLLLFWLLGYAPFQVFHIVLFRFNGLSITILNVLIFLALVWLVGILPRPLREIAMVVLLIWVLSVLGIIVVAGLSNILIIAMIVGVLLYVLGGGGRGEN
jgi:hypothetical protein